MGTRSSRERLTPRDAQRLAEQDAAAVQSRLDARELLDGAEDLIAEIDEVLVDRPFLIAFAQWDGE